MMSISAFVSALAARLNDHHAREALKSAEAEQVRAEVAKCNRDYMARLQAEAGNAVDREG